MPPPRKSTKTNGPFGTERRLVFELAGSGLVQVSRRALVQIRSALRALAPAADPKWVHGELALLTFGSLLGVYFSEAVRRDLQPSSKSVGKKRSLSELKKLDATLSSLKSQIKSLHWEALSAFKLPPEPSAKGLDALSGPDDGPVPESVLGQLDALQDATKRALDRLAKMPQTTAHRGRPKLYEPLFIAKWASAVYQRATGLPPIVSTNAADSNKAYGPFLDFLTRVFDALEISASAETWAREEAGEHRSRMEKKRKSER